MSKILEICGFLGIWTSFFEVIVQTLIKRFTYKYLHKGVYKFFHEKSRLFEFY
jgi:hypothetical protein